MQTIIHAYAALLGFIAHNKFYAFCGYECSAPAAFLWINILVSFASAFVNHKSIFGYRCNSKEVVLHSALWIIGGIAMMLCFRVFSWSQFGHAWLLMLTIGVTMFAVLRGCDHLATKRRLAGLEAPNVAAS